MLRPENLKNLEKVETTKEERTGKPSKTGEPREDLPLLVGAFISEAFGEGVVVDLQLGDLQWWRKMEVRAQSGG